jgi:hypothetical protein
MAYLRNEIKATTNSARDRALHEELNRLKAYAEKNPEKVRRANLIDKKERAEERRARASAKASNKAMNRDNKKRKLKSLSSRGSAGGGGSMNLASRGRSRSLLQQMKDASGPLNE